MDDSSDIISIDKDAEMCDTVAMSDLGGDCQEICDDTTDVNLNINDSYSTDTADESEIQSFHVGLIIDTKDEAKARVQRYCDDKSTKLVVYKNDDKTLHYVCTNSIHRKSKSSGVRVNQHYFYTGKQEIRRLLLLQ